MMRRLRTYPAMVLMLIFCTYYAGISLFSHTHITNGSSIVHSHLGGASDHEHSDSQYAVIDILSTFQSESVSDLPAFCTPFFQSSDFFFFYSSPYYLNEVCQLHTLRGPPQA